MTLGRNDPCFCGSGKKHKKCCMGMDNAAEPVQQEVCFSEQDDPGPMHPYNFARICTNPDNLKIADLTKKQLQRIMDRWSPAKVEKIPTKDLVQQLSAFGINAEKAAFIALSRGEISAWKLAKRWLKNAVDYLQIGDDEDFVCFAACELWKRYLPERPSLEMIDDWVQDGYELDEADELEEACDLWQRVWRRMLELFTPEMKTFKSVEPIFNISQFFSNWIQDYVLCLDSLIVDDDSWLKVGIPFTEMVLEQFSEEKEIIFFSCSLGRWLIQDGRPEEGVAVLEKVISSYPCRADGYVNLLHARAQSGGPFLNAERAIKVLERVKLACHQDEIDAWDIEQRLNDLIERSGNKTA